MRLPWTRSTPSIAGAGPTGLMVTTLTEYQGADELPVAVAFPPVQIDSLAALLSRLGMRQLHVAETGAAATEAGAARLVLTHIPPWHDVEVCLKEARESYGGPLEAAVPGATYTL